jgi:hypothetical protein
LDAIDSDLSELSDLPNSDDEGEDWASVNLSQPHDTDEDSLSEVEDDEPLLPPPPKNRKRRLVWKNAIFSKVINNADPAPPPLGPEEPIDYFKEYFDSEFYELAAEMTNLYSVQKTGSSLGTTASEIRRFIGIHIAMSAFKFPRYRMYWGSRTRIPLIADAMNFNRFSRLRNLFHLVDILSKDPENTDRVWKVRPVIDRVLKKTESIVPSEYVSVDEQMVPYTGALDIKQYIRGKPTPWGIKIFMLCNSNGIILTFDVYQGKKTILTEEQKQFGLGPGMVLALAGRVQLRPHTKIFFDNFFTSIPLLEELERKSMYGTGTIRANRVLGAKLESDTSLKKKGRGAFHELVSGEVCLIKWMDCRSVIVASNMIGSGNVKNVMKWCKKTKTEVQVTQPEAIAAYNLSMGGVDKLDQMVSYYRTLIRSKKWTLRLVFHLIDLAVVNSWLEYVEICKAQNMRQKNIVDSFTFRLDIAETLIMSEDTPRRRGRPRSLPSSEEEESDEEDSVAENRRKRKLKFRRPCSAVKKDSFAHWPEKFAAQNRCKNAPCIMKTRFMCTKCNVPLCLEESRNCFAQFHKPKET